jgi:hypothetical protein
MKLAWLCYDDDPEYPEVKIVFEEPDRYTWYSRVVPIVYAVIEK